MTEYDGEPCRFWALRVQTGMKARLREHPFEGESWVPGHVKALQAECSRRANNQPSWKHRLGRPWGEARGYNNQKRNNEREKEAR